MQGDVFKALADETRRAILDALLTTDGQTLTELTGRFPTMTRFGVMKHLAVLERTRAARQYERAQRGNQRAHDDVKAEQENGNVHKYHWA